MIARALVAASCRRALLVVLAGLALGAASLAYVVTHFAMSTDTESLIAASVPWRKQASDFDRAFPGKTDQIVVVIDGATAEVAERAAAELAAKLEPRHDLFRAVSRPAGGAFFDRNGLLFLSREEVKGTIDQLLAAQPLLGPLAADPSLRGAMTSLTTGLTSVHDGATSMAKLERPMRGMANVLNKAAHGEKAWFRWSRLVRDDPELAGLRRLVLLEPKLDYARLTPGAEATAAARAAAKDLGLTPANGVTLRITGSVALDDEQLGSLAEGVIPTTAAMILAVTIMLWLAVRSPKISMAILLTVFVGLFVTAAFGLWLYGRFNLISVAFVALFIGLGVDFAIQFSVRYRAEVAEGLSMAQALPAAGQHAGAGLTLAAAATAIGFFAFLPTSYVGFSQLGLIAGVGMIVALLLSLTLLPALLTWMKADRGGADAGFKGLAPVGRFLAQRRRPVLLAFAAVAVICAALTPFIRFDFDPVSLDSPRTESVSTLRDLSKNPDTTLNTLDVLAPNAQAARVLAAKLEALPEVAHAVTLTSFVPDDQPEKLGLIGDAFNLLDPTLNPFDVAPAPTDAERVQAMTAARQALIDTAAGDTSPPGDQARRLAQVLTKLIEGTPDMRERARAAMSDTLPVFLGQIRGLLTAQPVTLENLPPELKADWIAADGRVRVQVFPKGDPNDPRVTDRFVDAVQRVAGGAVSGAPIAVRGSTETILKAFAIAVALSMAAITALLFVVLKNARDVALTLAPVLLTALLTLATCVVLRVAINFENIIALPLLLSVGVAFTIYLVIAWRQGAQNLLDTSLARAVVFSALTTGLAFGSLWFSPHAGTSSMGTLLMISLGWTLISTLLFQPALLGPPRAAGVRDHSFSVHPVPEEKAL